MTFEEIQIGRMYMPYWDAGSLGITSIILDKNNVYADIIEENNGQYSLDRLFEFDDPREDSYTYYEDITENYWKSMDKLEIFKLLFKGN